MRGLFDANEYASISDADCTSDCSLSSTDSVAQEGASFKFPAKGRYSKPRIFKPKSQAKQSNRFKCFEEKNLENGENLGETGRKSPRIGVGGGWLGKGKSHQKFASSKVKSPPELSYETQLCQFKNSIDTSSKPSPENVSSDKLMMSSSGIPGVGGSPPSPTIPLVTPVVSAPEIMSTTDPISLFTQLDQQMNYKAQQLYYAVQHMQQTSLKLQSYPP
ncbi:MAG: hypothetical protein GY696_36915 [Gammaproteobacteria bacterium]|nr:hypothetical protein [Gammaproteobacteria bacterium]